MSSISRSVMIIGGSGFFGTNIAATFKALGWRVIVVDIVKPQIERVEYHRNDIRDYFYNTNVLKLMRTVDVIINCAGQTSHPISMQYPFDDAMTNVIGHIIFLTELRAMKSNALIVFTSSSTVTGAGAYIDDATREIPLDIYSANKLVGEHYYRIFNNIWGLKTCVLRFPNLYGRFGKPDAAYGFINYFIGLARQGKDISLYGDGHQLRSILSVSDAAWAITKSIGCQMLHTGKPFFVPGNQMMSVFDIAKEIADVWQVGISRVDWPPERKKFDVGDVRIESKVFSELTGWSAGRKLRSVLKWMKSCE